MRLRPQELALRLLRMRILFRRQTAQTIQMVDTPPDPHTSRGLFFYPSLLGWSEPPRPHAGLPPPPSGTPPSQGGESENLSLVGLASSFIKEQF